MSSREISTGCLIQSTTTMKGSSHGKLNGHCYEIAMPDEALVVVFKDIIEVLVLLTVLCCL
jgi:hypothetical protein